MFKDLLIKSISGVVISRSTRARPQQACHSVPSGRRPRFEGRAASKYRLKRESRAALTGEIPTVHTWRLQIISSVRCTKVGRRVGQSFIDPKLMARHAGSVGHAQTTQPTRLQVEWQKRIAETTFDEARVTRFSKRFALTARKIARF